MATKSTPPQSGKDPYAQRTKQLTSAAQRLRGWVSSDASREPELADALVELNAHRLRGHAYGAAAADVQEAARRATQLLTANGPIGPYTAVPDAVRYVAAVVHFAQLQVALAAADAAGRTLESLDPLRAQLPALEGELDATTAIWALLARAWSLLAVDEVSTANAYADAALDRWAESGLSAEPDAGYVVLDVERLAAEARWRAGRPDEALAHLHAAKARYDGLLDDRLAQPARLSPALLERLAEPLSSVYGDLADRLAAVGETELGLVIRRDLVDKARAVAARLPEPAVDRLVQALSDLAADLRAVGRVDEADAVVEEIRVLGRTPLDRARTPSGPAVTWAALDPATAYAASTAGSAGGAAERAIEAERERETSAWLEDQRAEAHRLEEERLEQARRDAARAEAERAAGERAAAEQRAADEARALEEARLDAERRAAEEAAEQAERKRRREERLAQYQAEQERAERERVEQERLEREHEEQDQAERDRAEAERRERADRHAEQAEIERREEDRIEAAQARAERLATERAEAERQAADDAEAERLAAEEAEAERVAAEQAEAERIAAERAEAEQRAAREAAADRLAVAEAAAERAEAERADAARHELEQAQSAFQEARTSGDRRSIRTAGDRLVEVLRPQVAADLVTYGPMLQATLEDLTSARLRGGDLFGSRAAAREAKEIGRRLAGLS